MKQISKKKADELGIPDDLLKKYGHETAKQFNKINGIGLFNELCSKIEDRPLTFHEIVWNELDVYGMPKSTFPDADKHEALVTEFDKKKSITTLTAYSIQRGRSIEMKLWTSNYENNPFVEGSFLYITSVAKKSKREPTGEINPETGKKIYRDTDQFEYWLQSYEVMRDRDV